MSDVKQEVLRMELQVGELIRLVANLNERLSKVEDNEKHRQPESQKARKRLNRTYKQVNRKDYPIN